MSSSFFSAYSRVAVGLLSSALLAGCGGNDETDASDELLPVGAVPSVEEVDIALEVDVYSGRPNPTWALSDEDVSRLEAILDVLPTTAQCPSPPRENLGFRSFIVTGVSTQGQDIRRLVVDADCVRAEALDGTRSQLLDEERTAHAYLKAVAVTHDPSLREAIPES